MAFKTRKAKIMAAPVALDVLAPIFVFDQSEAFWARSLRRNKSVSYVLLEKKSPHSKSVRNMNGC